MNRPYYFKLGVSGKEIYAEAGLPIPGTGSYSTRNFLLGKTPEEAAQGILKQLENSGQVLEIHIYTKGSIIPFRRNITIERNPISSEDLEAIVEHVAGSNPGITILRTEPQAA